MKQKMIQIAPRKSDSKMEFFFHISLLPQSLQTSVRRQLKIHDNTMAELEHGLCKTRVLKILFKEENPSLVREEVYSVIQPLQARENKVKLQEILTEVSH